MRYFSKSHLRAVIKQANENPDFADMHRIVCVNDKKLGYSKFNVPEFMIPDHKSFWKQYVIYWYLNEATRKGKNVCTNYFWGRI